MTTPAQRPGYFDALYAANPDPWGFTTSAYEDAKYATTLAALPRPRYGNALEVGCSIGVLTARLAPRCGRLTGMDVAAAAIAQARERCAAFPQVTFVHGGVPHDVPAERYDLIMLSEVLYYFDPPTIDAVADAVGAHVSPAADICLVHWLGPTPDYPLDGETAVGRFLERAAPWSRLTRQQRTPDYRLDVLTAG